MTLIIFWGCSESIPSSKWSPFVINNFECERYVTLVKSLFRQFIMKWTIVTDCVHWTCAILAVYPCNLVSLLFKKVFFQVWLFLSSLMPQNFFTETCFLILSSEWIPLKHYGEIIYKWFWSCRARSRSWRKHLQKHLPLCLWWILLWRGEEQQKRFSSCPVKRFPWKFKKLVL